MNDFAIYVGFTLGMLITFCAALIFSSSQKTLAGFLLNSFTGCILTILLLKLTNIYAPENVIMPITAICIGILGIPGAILILITLFLQFF